MKLIKWLDEHFEEMLLVLMLILIACVSMMQVVFRKVPFLASLTWAEEFDRFMWIMSVFISLPYTMRKGNMLRVSVLMDLLPETLHKLINLLVDIISTGCMGLLTFHSVSVVQKIIASGELSPAMLWPMSSVYSVMLFGFLLATLRGIQMIVIHAIHFGDKELSTIEQTMAEAAEEADSGKKAEGGAI